MFWCLCLFFTQFPFLVVLIALFNAHFEFSTIMASGELEARKEGSDGEGRLCDGFWGKFASLMNKDDVDTILSEQEDMWVCTS